MKAIKDALEFLKAVTPELVRQYGGRLKQAGIREFIKKPDSDEMEYVTETGEKVRVRWATFAFPDENVVIGIGQRIKEDDTCSEPE